MVFNRELLKLHHPEPGRGGNITYNVSVVNNGPDDATNVVLTDVLPAGVTVVSSTGFGSPSGSSTVTWALGTVANGATVSGTVTVMAAEDGAVANPFSVSSDAADSDSSATDESVTVNSTVAEDATGTVVTAGAFSATEGTAFSGQVAAFGDGTNQSPTGDYTAMIHWGDATGSGTDTAGVVGGGAGSPYTVTATPPHTYTEDGPFTFTVTVTETGITGGTASNSATATVSDLTVTGTPVSATEGTPVSGQVATFSDGPNTDAPGNFTAMIHWGDAAGSSTDTTGDVTQPGGSGNPYVVRATTTPHTYEEGAYTFTVTITEAGAVSSIAANSAAATVSDAALSSTPAGLTPPTAQAGTAFSNVQLFHFTDANPVATADDFSAVVTWGDGTADTVTSTPSAAGQIVKNAGEGFDVLGSHTYPAALSGQTFGVQVTDHAQTTGQSIANFSVIQAAVSSTATSVSVAFGPFGEVVLVVTPDGTLTQYDAFGAHVFGGGVRSASVGFSPAGTELVLVVRPDGTLTQYDATGAHLLGGGVQNASVAFGPFGEVVLVVRPDGTLTQYDTSGAHLLGSVRLASVAFGPIGEVVDVIFQDGTLSQFDSSGRHDLGGPVLAAGVAFGPSGAEVVDAIFQDGTLFQFDSTGAHILGKVF